MFARAAAVLIVGCFACAKSSATAPDAAPVTTSAASPPECPKQIGAELVGKPCPSDGQICSGSTNAVRMLQCSHGKWAELNVPPAPH